jgi:hypothetical protein
MVLDSVSAMQTQTYSILSTSAQAGCGRFEVTALKLMFALSGRLQPHWGNKEEEE